MHEKFIHTDKNIMISYIVNRYLGTYYISHQMEFGEHHCIMYLYHGFVLVGLQYLPNYGQVMYININMD